MPAKSPKLPKPPPKEDSGSEVGRVALRPPRAKRASAAAPTSYDSLKSAAAALNVPKYILQRAKAQPELARAFRGSRVYPIPELILFLRSAFPPGSAGRAATGSDSAAPTHQDKPYWDSRLAQQTFDQREWEFAQRRGQYIEKKIFAADLLALGSEQKAILRQKLENEFPGLCTGLEPDQRAELKKLGRTLADDLCARFARLVDKWKD